MYLDLNICCSGKTELKHLDYQAIMSLFYREEHLACRNYDNGARSTIEFLEIKKFNSIDSNSVRGKIIFALQGELVFSYGVYRNCILKDDEVLYIPPDCEFHLRANNLSKVLIVRISSEIKLCECYSFEDFEYETSTTDPALDGPHLLKVNRFVDSYINNLAECIKQGLRCRYFFDIKIKELFYLLRGFYSKYDLSLFFKELVSTDSSFSQFVLFNSHKYNTLHELANGMQMSVSNIERLFNKTYGMSGYKWMNNQKANNIYHALCTEKAPLKELAGRFGFSSTSSFNDFCKKIFGKTPGLIRKGRSVEK